MVHDPLPRLHDRSPIRSTSELSHIMRWFFLSPDARREGAKQAALTLDDAAFPVVVARRGGPPFFEQFGSKFKV